jgi:hypothetical protein
MTAVEWLFSELEQLIPDECQEVYKKALEMEIRQSEDYVAFGINCYKFDYPVLHFKDFIKL